MEPPFNKHNFQLCHYILAHILAILYPKAVTYKETDLSPMRDIGRQAVWPDWAKFRHLGSWNLKRLL